MEKWSSKHQRNHCLEQHLRKGAKMTPKGAPKRKKTLFYAQNRFLRSKSLFTKKCGNERKSAKRVKIGFRIPKKALSTARFRAHAVFWRSGAKKTQKCVLERKGRNFAHFHIFRPKSCKMHFWGENLKDP